MSDKGLWNCEPQDIVQKDDGSLWFVVGYQPNPTVILQQITHEDGSPVIYDDPTRETHAVGSLNAERFKKLGTFKRQSP